MRRDVFLSQPGVSNNIRVYNIDKAFGGVTPVEYVGVIESRLSRCPSILNPAFTDVL